MPKKSATTRKGQTANPRGNPKIVRFQSILNRDLTYEEEEFDFLCELRNMEVEGDYLTDRYILAIALRALKEKMNGGFQVPHPDLLKREPINPRKFIDEITPQLMEKVSEVVHNVVGSLTLTAAAAPEAQSKRGKGLNFTKKPDLPVIETRTDFDASKLISKSYRDDSPDDDDDWDT